MSDKNAVIATSPTGHDVLNVRRNFLKTGGTMGLAVLALGLVDIKPGWAQTRSTNEAGDARILNVALGDEHEAIAAYQAVAEHRVLRRPALKLALEFQGQHKMHAEALENLILQMGAHPVAAKPISAYHFPINKWHNQPDALRFAAGLEKGAAMAYLGTVPMFHNRGLAKTAASIMGDETMHWATWRHALGENPVPVAFI
ncbi:MAG: ferritin-like domain-containing protein [Acidiferrobacter sp.]